MKKEITIKGQKYKIKCVSELVDEYQVCEGLCEKIKHSISICKREDITENIKTCIHELVHAHLFECGLVDYSNRENINYYVETQFYSFVVELLNMLKIVYPDKKKIVDCIFDDIEDLLR